MRKGRTPIEKNIVVIDANNERTANTYIKRAKGLVKSGRAVWVDDTTIRMVSNARSASHNLAARENEEIKMANNAYEVIDNQLTKMQEQLREQNAADVAETRAQIIGCLLTLEENRRKDSLRQFAKDQLEYVKSSVKEPDSALAGKVLDLTMQIVESETEIRAEEEAEAETEVEVEAEAAVASVEE